jgi:hypothetical protein
MKENMPLLGTRGIWNEKKTAFSRPPWMVSGEPSGGVSSQDKVTIFSLEITLFSCLFRVRSRGFHDMLSENLPLPIHVVKGDSLMTGSVP